MEINGYYDAMMQYKEPARSQVVINDGFLNEKQGANRRYLMSLDSDALLLHFRSEAVLDKQPEKIFGGWEKPTSQVRGHFTGHWLSAAAMLYAATGDIELKAKADCLVAELAKCQEANGGEWAASIPEKYLDRIARGKRVWAPQYVIHKTFMGLLDMYRLAGNKQALEIAKNWSKWYLRWTAKFSREEMDNILDVETGGMLEMWALLYGITKKKDYITLMERYRRGRLFDALLEGKDVLTNMHANTTIPEIMGAAAAYEATGEETWLAVVKAYWKQAVTLRGRFVTGGQTSGEIWTPPMAQAARLTDKNQEHCTVYNMMRVADFLFRVTGEKEYADYWEQNLYNGVFAQGYWRGRFPPGTKSPYPNQGLLIYFLPLRAGARKAWATETEDFFCCHGTLVQANASLNRGVYYLNEDETPGIAVCQFFNSELKASLGGTGVKVKQIIDTLSGSELFSSTLSGMQRVSEICGKHPHNPDMLRAVFEIETEKPTTFEFKIRVPFWIKGEPVLLVNGKKEIGKKTGGWVSVKREWSKGTVVVEFKKGINAWPLPDEAGSIAFLYGPMALAGLCEDEIRLEGDPQKPETILAPDNEREWGAWMNTFKTKGQEKNIRFVPLHQVGYDPYTVYFPVGKTK
jgi:DUF1680 family protein